MKFCVQETKIMFAGNKNYFRDIEIELKFS